MFASVVLYSWPVVVATFFRMYAQSLALVLAVVVGYLLLPGIPGLDLPLLPPINKDTLPIAVAAFLVLAMGRGKNQTILPGWIPQHILARLFLAAFLAGALLTAITNGDALVFGPTVLSAMSPRDGLSMILIIGAAILPLLLGRKLLGHPDQQRMFLRALAMIGAAYACLALYEIRMSPQLNVTFYDFFPHQWRQHIRSGGYRPVVFLHHGLWLAIFFAMALIAAFGAWEGKNEPRKNRYLAAGLWILATLGLSNSLGGLAIGVLLLGILIIFKGQMRWRFIAGFAALVMTYPALRGAGYIPVDAIYEFALSFDADRAASLNFRLTNEDIILERAREKPLFGWGGFGRNFVHDAVTGRPISVPDGYWVIAISKGGWTQYIAEFGLLCMPLIICWRNAQRYGLGRETSALGLVLCANLLDLIPNATATPLTWLVAGAIWGRIEFGNVAASEENNDQAQKEKNGRQLAYTRFPATQNVP